MRLVNQTIYNTRDLKKFFTRIAKVELEPEKSKRVLFRVVYSHRGRHSGCASLGGCHGTVRLPKPPHAIKMPSLAMVIAHEMAHLRGMDHNRMRGAARYSWDYGRIYDWAGAYTIGIKSPKAKPPKTVVVNTKLVHAQKMLAQNKTKLKRAETLVKKWTSKVRYYERKKVELPLKEEVKRVKMFAAASTEISEIG